MRRLLCITLVAATLGFADGFLSFSWGQSHNVPFRPRVAAAAGFVVGHARVAACIASPCNGGGSVQDFTITWEDGGSHTPTAAIFHMTWASTNATVTAQLSYGVGVAVSATERWTSAIGSEDAQASADTRHYSSDINCLALIDNGGTVEALADFDSFGSNTVSIDWGTIPPTAYFVHILAFTGTDGAWAGTADPSDTDTGTINVTGLGATANFAYVVGVGTVNTWAETLTDDTPHTEGFYSYDGSTARQGAYRRTQRDGSSTADSRVSWVNNGLAISGNEEGTTHVGYYSGSSHASGITITTNLWGTNSDVQLGLLLLDLPDSQDAYVGNFTTNSATGTQAITDPGFEPQAIALLSSHMDIVTATAANHQETATPDADGMSFGTAISVASQFSLSIHIDDGHTTMDTNSRTDSGQLAYVLKEDNAGDGIIADLDSFDASGFTIDLTTTGSDTANWVYVVFQ